MLPEPDVCTALEVEQTVQRLFTTKDGVQNSSLRLSRSRKINRLREIFRAKSEF